MQRKTIFALYFRELMTRFGKYNLGLIWALLEPITHVTLLSLIFFAVSKNSYQFDYPVFVMTGIMPWILFKNVITRSLNATSVNAGLFFYRNVKPIDTILARAILELNVHIFASSVLLFIFYLIGFDVGFDNFLLYASTILTLFFFSLGLGLFLAVICAFNDDVQKFVTMLFRPLYFISGIFFSISIVPEPSKSILLYNPIIHAIELVRDGFNESFDSGYASYPYLATSALITMGLGLFYYHHNWKRIIDR
ncbi:MAG: ABC transporter permease [Rickettsiales bacterium]|nr:ABC transporter permease [Rickettsiales bacterium]